jgi:hypothetical protein
MWAVTSAENISMVQMLETWQRSRPSARVHTTRTLLFVVSLSPVWFGNLHFAWWIIRWAVALKTGFVGSTRVHFGFQQKFTRSRNKVRNIHTQIRTLKSVSLELNPSEHCNGSASTRSHLLEAKARDARDLLAIMPFYYNLFNV